MHRKSRWPQPHQRTGLRRVPFPCDMPRDRQSSNRRGLYRSNIAQYCEAPWGCLAALPTGRRCACHDGAVTWTAPEVTRPEGPLTGGERPMLQAFLDWHRATLLHKCAGLTGAQLTGAC